MIRSRIALSVAFIAFALPAMAQSACDRDSGRTIKIGGVDLAEMRCMLETSQQMVASYAQTNVAQLATQRMLQADLAASKKQLAEVQEGLTKAQAELAKLKAAKSVPPVAQKEPNPKQGSNLDGAKQPERR